MRIFGHFLFLAALLTAGYARAGAWPPQTRGALDSIKTRMSVIAGLPDSLITRNFTIYSDMVDIDEYNIYVVNQQPVALHVQTRIDAADESKTKSFGNVALYDDKGGLLKTATTSEWGVAWLDIQALQLPDGVYRLRVDYGKKHTENETKPKERIALRVSPSGTPVSKMRTVALTPTTAF